MALEPREQDGEAGPTADGHDLGATFQVALLVEQIDHACLSGRQQRMDDRAVKARQGERCERCSHEQEETAADLAPSELEGQVPDPAREMEVFTIEKA